MWRILNTKHYWSFYDVILLGITAKALLGTCKEKKKDPVKYTSSFLCPFVPNAFFFHNVVFLGEIYYPGGILCRARLPFYPGGLTVLWKVDLLKQTWRSHIAQLSMFTH